MVIRIVRAFERTRQIADFVPIKAYCAASTEIESIAVTLLEKDIATVTTELSSELAKFCEREVDKTLMSYYPQCIVCGGKGQKMSLNKEGVCGNCVKTAMFQARDFQKESEDTKSKVAKK